MDAMRAQAMSAEAQQRRQQMLGDISAALSRIENHEFGYCLNCGEGIAIARLEIAPANPLCIDCAEKRTNE